MKPVRILVDTLVDHNFFNAQLASAREIIARLDARRFHVSAFFHAEPDPRLLARPATRLIRLPRRLATSRLFPEFVLGPHRILFYVKAAPASRWYFRMRRRWRDRRVTIGTIESQCNLRSEPTISPQAVKVWEETVLRCDRLYSNSKSAARSLRAEYGRDSEVIPTGVDTGFFSPPGERRSMGPVTVLFVGSLRPFKGPDLVIEAAARHRDAKFVLVGEGPMAADLEERCRRDGLSNVTFRRGLAADELREQYRAADVFLLPSRWEGSPKVILEAAACGLPVIARRDYDPETVIEGQSGWVVGGDEELFARLEETVRSRDLRERMGLAAREHARTYDWARIVPRWEQVFEDLTP